jgi:outer membrane protein
MIKVNFRCLFLALIQIGPLLLLTQFPQVAIGIETSNADEDPYWEYGAGVGFIRLEHYPAARFFNDLVLPFPTFQYRGRILRADDREGAHLYLLKGADWAFDIAGTGYAALTSSDNEDRAGLQSIPWILALGPRFSFNLNPQLALSFSVFGAIATDFQKTKTNGQIYQGKIEYRWDMNLPSISFFEKGASSGNVAFLIKAASQELLSLYFEVPQESATANRGAYEAQAGFLNSEVSYYQSFKSGRSTLYIGGSWAHYGLSANRQSPLHKSEQNLVCLIGLTYVLGESSKREVPEDDTSGLFNRPPF